MIATSATTLQARMRGDAELIESVAIVNTLVEGIRDDALTLRMVPINEIFNRFPRLVHELSQQTGKEIQLQIRNADTDIDKSMVEKLTDPLMHLVRNAADHGLEEQQIRLAAGKTAQGTITLNAYHDGAAPWWWRSAMTAAASTATRSSPRPMARGCCRKARH
ncbi:hypothetical protein R5M74_07680 [Aeromonas hydrophila]|nr:hypothetical protein R5M74_07680 [Aeromonas hydrophila]